jgi:hypothetical protein
MRTLSKLTWQVKTLLATLFAAFLLMLFCTAKVLTAPAGMAKTPGENGGYPAWDAPSNLVLAQQNRQQEASDWMQQLFLFKNSDLDGEALSKKYLNLMLAATALGAAATESWEQRYWSDLAVGFGETAKTSAEGAGLQNLDEINARLLVAMALNFYQGSRVDGAILKKHYEAINKMYLFRSGFCQYGIVQALQRVGIIQLPDFPKEVNI